MSLHVKFFDKQDNCIQVNNTLLAKELRLSRRTLGRFINAMKEDDVIRSVTDIYSKVRLMVNPNIRWSYDLEAKRFSQNMFLLCSHSEAIEVSKLERSMRGVVDVETGEIFRDSESTNKALQQGCDYVDRIDSTHRTYNRAGYKADLMDLEKKDDVQAEVKRYYSRTEKYKRLRDAYEDIARTSFNTIIHGQRTITTN
tara:strand:+ start:210 stop:803 length:594 start_codon:yes stop_codon:yes gene_type:complete